MLLTTIHTLITATETIPVFSQAKLGCRCHVSSRPSQSHLEARSLLKGGALSVSIPEGLRRTETELLGALFGLVASRRRDSSLWAPAVMK